jgi:hypothetical protein
LAISSVKVSGNLLKKMDKLGGKNIFRGVQTKREEYPKEKPPAGWPGAFLLAAF